MYHNDTDHIPYLILLRVASSPQGLWRSLQGNVLTVPFMAVEPPAIGGSETRRNGDLTCSAP
jgi:hypothetical protein